MTWLFNNKATIQISIMHCYLEGNLCTLIEEWFTFILIDVHTYETVKWSLAVCHHFIVVHLKETLLFHSVNLLHTISACHEIPLCWLLYMRKEHVLRPLPSFSWKNKTNMERLCIRLYTPDCVAFHVTFTWNIFKVVSRQAWQYLTKPCDFSINIFWTLQNVQEKKNCICLSKSQLKYLDYVFGWSVPVKLPWRMQRAGTCTDIGLWLDVWIIKHELGEWMHYAFVMPLSDPHNQ